MKKNNNHEGVKGVALSIASIATGVLGGYFLFGTKEGKEARSHLKSWAFKAKGEVLEKLEKMGDLTKDEYHAVVEKIAGKYASLKGVNRADVEKVVNDIKKQWNNVEKHVSAYVKSNAAKSAKSVRTSGRKNAPKKK